MAVSKDKDFVIVSGEIDTRLHKAKKCEDILQLISQTPKIDVNIQIENGDTPLHAYVRKGPSGYPLLLTLLSHCDPSRLQLETYGENLNTPLHLAAEMNNITAAAALISFGADVDSLNFKEQTPLDLAISNNHDEMRDLLFSLDSELGEQVCQRLSTFVKLPKAPLGSEKEGEEKDDEYFSLDWKGLSVEKTDSLKSLSGRAEGSFRAWLEWKKRREVLKSEKQKKRHQSFTPPIFKKTKGHRVLCLDGGGMRGLIQIEVLSHITEVTGREIHELFDWIVGTSTGGIVALALVYGCGTSGFSITSLRQLYFEIKDKVFGKGMLNYLACDTEALEEILKRVFGDKKMTEVPHGTKVLISAVDKSTDKLELCWFNNCFHDNMYGETLWKVGRCTSAAPCYFKPMGKFVDGGLRANNPSEDSLTVIQDYLQKNYPDDPHLKELSLVVSVGCGEFPGKELGDICLFFGKHWLNPLHLRKLAGEVMNLVTMLAQAINNSEQASENTRSRCDHQRIPFYRFSPQFDEEIPLSETNNEVLCNMVLKARAHVSSKQTHMDELIQSFYFNETQPFDFNKGPFS